MRSSSIGMLRALRDELGHRVLASEDYRAFVALDAQLAALGENQEPNDRRPNLRVLDMSLDGEGRRGAIRPTSGAAATLVKAAAGRASSGSPTSC